jgi:hypothetical protein
MTDRYVPSLLVRIVPHTIAIGIAVVGFLIYDRNATNAIERTRIEFPIVTHEEPLNEKVIERYCPPEVRCSTPPVSLIFRGGKKNSIIAYESLDGSTTFIDLIAVGDSLVKELMNDTLVVYKDGKATIFRLHYENRR